MNESNFRQELLEQARALVFNNGSDAAALAFRPEGSGAEQDFHGLDLTALDSIHRAANGGVELKFIDRIKLIELLLSAEAGEGGDKSGGFIEALDRAAKRLGTADEAGETEDARGAEDEKK